MEQIKTSSKLAKFGGLLKDMSKVISIEARDVAAEKIEAVAEFVEPTPEQRKFAASKRNEWEQKANQDAKLKGATA